MTQTAHRPLRPSGAPMKLPRLCRTLEACRGQRPLAGSHRRPARTPGLRRQGVTRPLPLLTARGIPTAIEHHAAGVGGWRAGTSRQPLITQAKPGDQG